MTQDNSSSSSSSPPLKSIADQFVLHAIQERGDTPEVRVRAVQHVLDLAGFDAIATCWPVFGGIWRIPCGGPDGAAATAWLNELTDSMERGDFHKEAAHVVRFIQARREVIDGHKPSGE